MITSFIMREIPARVETMTPPDQLPATIKPSALTTLTDSSHLVPALIADAGEPAAWRYIEFFTANIRNPNTRRAYARACNQFFAWCEDRGLTLTTIRPFDVATYIETLQQTHSPPGVKQQLAAVRMLFDWLIVGQIVPSNPTSAVRGPKHVVKTGKTPVLDGAEWRKLLDSIPVTTLEDLRPRGAGWSNRLHEKRRQAPSDAVPPRARRGAARLYQRSRHCRRSQRLPVPHLQRPQRQCLIRTSHGPARRLAHDPPAGGGRGDPRVDRQSHLSRHRDHRVPLERRCARARAG